MRITFLFGVYEVSVTGDGHIFVRDNTTAVQ
jgi:hypothetical protein